VSRIDEVVTDPQIRVHGMPFEQEHPILGRITTPNVPFKFSDVNVAPRQPAPFLDQDNREILTESWGYAGVEVDTLERDGVLYAEEAGRGQVTARSERWSNNF